MVHSGSAAGGHYYACIRSFSDGQWYSFNDQHVIKIKLFFVHPTKMVMMESKLEVHKDKTLMDALEIAYKSLDCCRLVKYDEFHEYLERSYEGEEDTPMGLLLAGVKSSYMFDLLLETRRPEQVFQPYKSGGQYGEPMELSEEERSDLVKKESSQLLKTGQRVSYSPRKEKALKIYLDGGAAKDPGLQD
ncbi:hypothetical protein AAFF_G00383130 [Aldrovandia affinis]|uniref:Deubiquitinating enzyme 47 n=1 Tax=Aldrovandia affinis TaxID=143900 RepID=A0AAD7X096_9TELE|nr:hypothetical protein AAFF_G00383130 [Aldrovandia affinis]